MVQIASKSEISIHAVIFITIIMAAGIVSEFISRILSNSANVTDFIIIAAIIGHATAFVAIFYALKTNDKNRQPDFKGKIQ